MSRPTIQTPLTSLLGISHPVLLAGMARASGPSLAAAVSNAGGLGVIGGLGYTPQQLRDIIKDMKSQFRGDSVPFGVDLALPQIGGGARATNHDYTNGRLEELVEVIIEEKAKLFVSAVGVPPQSVIKRLHEAGILVMNMVGAVRHAVKALEAGVDIVCGQGGEGGGHTGDIPTSLLIPAVVDVANRFRSPLTGGTPLVVAAGGVFDGRGLAAALMYGASGVWIGTRFVASLESGASAQHKKAIVEADWGETERTLVVTGRPLRVLKNDYVREWEARGTEMRALLDQGIVPFEKDLEDGQEVDLPFLSGSCAPLITNILPAAVIVEQVVADAEKMLRAGANLVRTDQKAPSKL